MTPNLLSYKWLSNEETMKSNTCVCERFGKTKTFNKNKKTRGKERIKKASKGVRRKTISKRY
jgi:hypothetical protein